MYNTSQGQALKTLALFYQALSLAQATDLELVSRKASYSMACQRYTELADLLLADLEQVREQIWTLIEQERSNEP